MTSPSKAAERLNLSISGMSCGHCVRAVTEALSGLKSVKLLDVGVGAAELEALSPSAESDAIAALGEAGYSAKITRLESGLETQAKSGCCSGPKGCCG